MTDRQPTGPVVADVIEGDQPFDKDTLTIGREALVGPGEVWLRLGNDGEWWTPHDRTEITHVVMVPRPAPPPLAVGAGVRWRGFTDGRMGDLYGYVLAHPVRHHLTRVLPYNTSDSAEAAVETLSSVLTTVPPEQMPAWESPVAGFFCWRGGRSVPPEVAEELDINGSEWWFNDDRDEWQHASAFDGEGIRPDQAALLSRALTRGGGA